MIETFLDTFVSSFPYLGIFIANLIISASIVFPLPSQLPILTAVLLGLNPYLTSAVSALGSMIGEMTGYGVGLMGRKLTEKKLKRNKKLVSMIRKYHSRYAFWVILLTAFLFFPFDLVGILSGLGRYDVKKFFIAGLIGKFLKTVLLYFLIQEGIQLFGFTTGLAL